MLSQSLCSLSSQETKSVEHLHTCLRKGIVEVLDQTIPGYKKKENYLPKLTPLVVVQTQKHKKMLWPQSMISPNSYVSIWEIATRCCAYSIQHMPIVLGDESAIWTRTEQRHCGSRPRYRPHMSAVQMVNVVMSGMQIMYDWRDNCSNLATMCPSSSEAGMQEKAVYGLLFLWSEFHLVEFAADKAIT